MADPPFDGIFMMGPLLVPNKMTSPIQLPPRTTLGMSHRFRGGPPEISNRFNLPAAPNAIDRLSSDQKNETAPSLPAIGRASSESIGRIQICIWPSAPIAV